MFRILFLLLTGIGIGCLLRRIPTISHHIEKSTRYTIFLLLFIFGVSIGSNHSIIENLASFGIEAFIISILGIIGSFATVILFKHLSSKKKGGEK